MVDMWSSSALLETSRQTWSVLLSRSSPWGLEIWLHRIERRPNVLFRRHFEWYSEQSYRFFLSLMNCLEFFRSDVDATPPALRSHVDFLEDFVFTHDALGSVNMWNLLRWSSTQNQQWPHAVAPNLSVHWINIHLKCLQISLATRPHRSPQSRFIKLWLKHGTHFLVSHRTTQFYIFHLFIG